MRDSSIGFSMFCVSGAYQVAAGDLGDRFGNNFAVGAAFLRKTRTNWIWGAEGQFLFGGQVREDSILRNISTSQGYILTDNGTYADIILHERGYSVMAQVGRLFPVFGPNPNSGLTLLLGAGFLQHKIRIEDRGNEVSALAGDYKKGYDRLTNGFCLSQFAGYRNFSNNRRINFYIGLEAVQGFTRSRRSVNFDTMEQDTSSRLDLFFGIRAGWIIPLYKKLPRTYYYD